MARGLRRDPEPRVANDDRGARRAVGKEGKFFGIARDVDHNRIDLEERPVLPRLAVTGERPSSKPDDPDRTVGSWERLGLAHGPPKARLRTIIERKGDVQGKRWTDRGGLGGPGITEKKK